MNKYETIRLLKQMIIRPSCLYADGLGFELSTDDLCEIYDYIGEYYVKHGSSTERKTRSDTAMQRLIEIGGSEQNAFNAFRNMMGTIT